MLAIDRYFDERNENFKARPKRAGKKIWGKEIVEPSFDEANNCKIRDGNAGPLPRKTSKSYWPYLQSAPLERDRFISREINRSRSTVPLLNMMSITITILRSRLVERWLNKFFLIFFQLTLDGL